MSSQIRKTFTYDVTREMRRLALRGELLDRYPIQGRRIEATLRHGGRIVFSPNDEEFYEELDLDRVIVDPRSGRATGVRRL